MSRLWLVPLLATACSAAPARQPIATVPYAAPALPVPAVAREGDPDDDALRGGRLVASSCDASHEAQGRRIEELVRRQREEGERALADWARDARLSCHRDPPRGDPRDPMSSRGRLWNDTIGESFGRGGLGVSVCGCSLEAERPPPPHGLVQASDREELELAKTDGTSVAVLGHGALRVIDAATATVRSVTPLDGDARGLFVFDDHALVFVARAGSTEVIVLADLHAPRPRVLRHSTVSGSLASATRDGDAVHAVLREPTQKPLVLASLPDDLPECGASPEQVREARARAERLWAENERRLRTEALTLPTLATREGTEELCDLWQAAEHGATFTTLLTVDLAAPDSRPAATTVRTDEALVAVSHGAVYLTTHHDAPTQSGENQGTAIHRFSFRDATGGLRYTGVGLVPGRVQDARELDTWEGTLRVTSVLPSQNQLSLLVPSPSGNLIRVAALEHVGGNARLRAVRFDGDRAYVTTDAHVPPTFALDLDNPLRPRVQGVLDLPGVPAYLQRSDATHLFAIGFETKPSSTYDALSLQMLDARTFAPSERLRVGLHGRTGELDQVGLTFDPARKLVALAATSCDGVGAPFAGLVVLSADAERGFREVGRVTHGVPHCDRYAVPSPVRRGVFAQNRLFSITEDSVVVQDLEHLGHDVAEISFMR